MKIKTALKYIILSAILSVNLLSSAFAQSEANQPEPSLETKAVTAIEVKGNKTISMSTILSKIKTRVGQNYLQSVISDDLKRLYNTGYFSDVKVDRQEENGGFKVIILLEEKSIIEEVTFSKTKYIKSKALARKIKTQVGKFLDKKLLKGDEDIIKDLYAKKGLTSAEVEVETFIDEVTNKASVHFVISEGNKIRIKKINIIGNDSYKKGKLLKVIKSRTKGVFRSGYLKEEVMKEDIERLKSFYEQNGYIDIVVDYNEELLYQGYKEVNINIKEGKRYSVGNIFIVGNEIISDKEISRVMKEIQEAGIFSRDKLSVDVANIRTLYFDRGYIFANVQESTSLDNVSGKVDVTLDIVEGGLAYIEKVKIQGNTRTRDIVIRRELRMYPGDRFDGSQLRRSKERLNNLGYFEDVSFDIEDTDTYDRKNLVVQVKEAKTGTFSFGGGFSTVDKVVGFVEVEQKNFDFKNWPTFTGGGQNLVLRAEAGSTKNNLLLSFTEPWIFDYPISGGFDAFRTERNREQDIGYAYDELRVGGNLRLGKQFSEYLKGNVFYRRENITIGNIEDGVSQALKDEEGKNTVSAIGTSLTRDSRDNVFSPKTGFVVSSGADIAGGALGGTKDFYRLKGNGSYYVPLEFNSVLELSIMGGMVNEYGDSNEVPIFERFFAGGANSIRGYNERKVGPIDPVSNDPLGGEAILVSNIELTIPLVDFIKFATFFDTGNVWATTDDLGSGDFKSGTGIGLRVKTPIGPINLDYGYPLNDEPGEESRSGKFYFSVSRGF